jgi:hypothetical protein
MSVEIVVVIFGLKIEMILIAQIVDAHIPYTGG